MFKAFLIAVLLSLSTFAYSKDLVVNVNGVVLTLTDKKCSNAAVNAIVEQVFADESEYKKEFRDGTATWPSGQVKQFCYIVNKKDLSQIFIVDPDEGPIGVVTLGVKKE